MEKKYELLGKTIGAILFIFIILITTIYSTYSGRLTEVIGKNKMIFEICDSEIFSRDDTIGKKIESLINENDLKVLELKCIKQFPNKRDVTITMKENSDGFSIGEEKTIKKDIDIPENTILDKSTMDIEFKVTRQNVTEGMTFFGYSIGKIQMRDATTRLGATSENIIKKSYTLDEIYYEGDDTQLIMTNMLGNDIDVNYKIQYYLENY